MQKMRSHWKISKGMCVMNMFPFIIMTMTHWFLIMFLLISRQENRLRWSDHPEVERQPSVRYFRDFMMYLEDVLQSMGRMYGN